MTIKYEYRDAVARFGEPILEPNASRQYSFRSVFGYPEETVQFIQSNGNTQGLKGKLVYCDTVLIDIDEEENVEQVLHIISDLGIGNTVWNTGNRGVHLHIPIEPITGVNVVYSVTEWLKGIGVWSLIDSSIYREGGQFRVPGATHTKTGRVKVLETEVDGTVPTVTLLVPPPVAPRNDLVTDGDPLEFYLNLLQRRGEGGRHMHLFILWQSGRAMGLDRDELESALHWWNDTKTDTPHTSSMMAKKLKGFK